MTGLSDALATYAVQLVAGFLLLAPLAYGLLRRHERRQQRKALAQWSVRERSRAARQVEQPRAYGGVR